MKPLRVDHFNKFVSDICYTSTQMIKMLNAADLRPENSAHAERELVNHDPTLKVITCP